MSPDLNDAPWPDVDVADNHAEVLAAWLTVQRAVEAVATAMTARMQEEGDCTLLEHQALYRLATAPGRRLSMLRLADALATSPSGATRVVERLFRRGWVAREQPPDNRRQTEAVLTAEGYTALTERTRPAYHRALAECFGDLLSTADLAELRGVGRALLAGHDLPDQHRYPDFQQPEPRPDDA
ncbi:MarR family winged helix-turn-helix transcriptional regulator [Longispora urticae]